MKKYFFGFAAFILAASLVAFTTENKAKSVFAINYLFDDNVSTNPTAQGNADGVATLAEALNPRNFRAVSSPSCGGAEVLCAIDAATTQQITVSGVQYTRPVIDQTATPSLYSQIEDAVQDQIDGVLVDLKD